MNTLISIIDKYIFVILILTVAVIGFFNPEYKETFLIFTGLLIIASEIHAMRAR